MCNTCGNGCLPSVHAYSIGTYPSYSLKCGHTCNCNRVPISAPVCITGTVLKTKYEPTKPPVFWAKAEHRAAVDA